MGGLIGGSFSLLSKDEVYRVHLASLYILEKVGLKVNSEKALNVLKEGGAYVDFKEKRVWIPKASLRRP
ncbi:MAG: hypothetical protein DRN61_05460 [Thaumarchaeota archaeon]|nr:MAG: hypothetical protein DRN61_05460 [Nitrososphaerota archaeon]